MARYVDGYVLPVPVENLDAYRKMAAEAGELWMKHGAIEFIEAVGEDLDPEVAGATMRTFPQLVDTEVGETIVFSYIVFESREHRDEVNAKVMEEIEKESDLDVEMPFDSERMAYGGFNSIVHFHS